MPRFSVILVEPKYQGNIGSVARVMKNFGFGDMVLVKPPEIGPEARAKSMHGIGILRKSARVDDFSGLMGKFDFLVATSAIIGANKNPLRTPVKPEGLANAIRANGKIGLVFGREDYGLFNGEIEQCDLLVSIPASPKYPTLSLPQSVGIILYELTRLRMGEKLRGQKHKKLGKTEKRVLLEKFDHLVDLLYVGDFQNKLVKKTFRQLLGRAFVSGREAFTLIGLFRRVGESIKT